MAVFLSQDYCESFNSKLRIELVDGEIPFICLPPVLQATRTQSLKKLAATHAPVGSTSNQNVTFAPEANQIVAPAELRQSCAKDVEWTLERTDFTSK